jgi:peptide/nickel transport system substrate-binding protein
MRRVAFAGVAGAVAAVSLVACSAPAAEVSERSLTVAVSGLYYAEPPYTADYAGFDLGSQATYESLIGWSTRTDGWVPAMAESVTESEDRKTLTIRLREGVKFSDGTVLDAENAKAVMDSIIFDEEMYNRQAAIDSGLEIVVIDDLTLEMRGDVPLMLGVPVSPGLPSPTAYLDPEIQATMVDVPVGSGPYLREEVVPDVSATYVRNPDYWNPDAVDFESVTFEIFDDPIAILNALKSGQIDAGQIPANFVADAEDAGLSVYVPPARTSNFLLILDSAGEIIPALGDVRVRQAMAMAFDRASIVEKAQNGLGNGSSQVFPEDHPAHVDGEDDRYPFDVERARELMADAGYEDGFDLVIPKPGPEAPTWYGQYNPELEPIVQQSLADIGIRVTFEVEENMSAKSSTHPVWFWMLGPEAVYIHSTAQGADDWRPMLDAEATASLEAIRSGTRTEVDQSWAEFGEHSLDEAWFIPVSQVVDAIWATRADIDFDMTDPDAGVLLRFHIAD